MAHRQEDQGGQPVEENQAPGEMIVFDTDVLSIIDLPDTPEYHRVQARIAQTPPDEIILTTVINYEEQTRGWLAFVAKAKTARQEADAYRRACGTTSSSTGTWNWRSLICRRLNNSRSCRHATAERDAMTSELPQSASCTMRY
jgi:hypothetical protein